MPGAPPSRRCGCRTTCRPPTPSSNWRCCASGSAQAAWTRRVRCPPGCCRPSRRTATCCCMPRGWSEPTATMRRRWCFSAARSRWRRAALPARPRSPPQANPRWPSHRWCCSKATPSHCRWTRLWWPRSRARSTPSRRAAKCGSRPPTRGCARTPPTASPACAAGSGPWWPSCRAATTGTTSCMWTGSSSMPASCLPMARTSSISARSRPCRLARHWPTGASAARAPTWASAL